MQNRTTNQDLADNVMDRETFIRAFDVSRETCRRLDIYLDLLSTWTSRINLVSEATLGQAWSRHLADSAQLLDLASAEAHTWIDLGSGAGLPGLPVAALATQKRPNLKVTLVESDRRKSAFLQTAARKMELNVKIEPRRIEALPPQPFDVVSARALAPLDRLCGLACRFKGSGTVFLFPKGAKLDSELTAAARHWHIRAERIASLTCSDAAILRIVELEPRR